jgi:hypothetical protein
LNTEEQTGPQREPTVSRMKISNQIEIFCKQKKGKRKKKRENLQFLNTEEAGPEPEPTECFEDSKFELDQICCTHLNASPRRNTITDKRENKK